MGLRSEILEQPSVLMRLLEKREEEVGAAARAIRERGPRFVFLAARGSSDHAALYAKYLWGAFNRLPVALAAPSLFTLYRRPPLLQEALVVGISQSGQSPDIVGVVAEGRRQGALTLAITNAPDSPLAHEAELVVDIGAGEEQAVAATKTYTAQLMAVAMLSVAMEGDETRWEALRRVPPMVEQALETEVERATERYRYMERCVVLGRGYNYATAFEWALKIKELTYVIAEPYSSAELRHGPIALVEPGFPVLAVAPSGAACADMLSLLQELVAKHRAEPVVISDMGEALALARAPLPLPSDLPEWISPLVSIIPAQLFCYHLAQARGYDPDSPRSLRKVTLTL